jgi:hypothetical protein
MVRIAGQRWSMAKVNYYSFAQHTLWQDERNAEEDKEKEKALQRG